MLQDRKVRRTKPSPCVSSELYGELNREDNITLDALIRLANSKLKDGQPFTPETVYRYYRRRDPGRSGSGSMSARVESIHRLPPEAQEWIWLSFVGQHIEGFIGQVRTLLRRIGEANREKLSNPIIYGEPCYLKRGPDGKLKCFRDPVLTYLEGVEMERIRECEECKRIFWAGRKDKPCCSSKCGNIRRVRKWREQYLEDYKLRYR